MLTLILIFLATIGTVIAIVTVTTRLGLKDSNLQAILLVFIPAFNSFLVLWLMEN